MLGQQEIQRDYLICSKPDCQKQPIIITNLKELTEHGNHFCDEDTLGSFIDRVSKILKNHQCTYTQDFISEKIKNMRHTLQTIDKRLIDLEISLNIQFLEYRQNLDEFTNQFQYLLQKGIEDDKLQAWISNNANGDYLKNQIKNFNIFGDKVNLKFKEIDGQLNLLNTLIAKDFHFSQILKSPTISLEGKIAKQTTILSSSNYNRIALVEPCLDLNIRTRLAFKINELSCWVGLGICFVKVLQAKNFSVDYDSLGHGSYLISHNAYSWSHSKKEDNVVKKSFNFTTGDIIICEFDPVKKIIQFKKKGDNTKKYQLQIEIPDNDEVYACVNLCSKNDMVQLVMNEVYEEEF